MADFTKNAIKATFLIMLDEMPLHEITVKGIATECGISRNTFYYHFQDIPELIEEVIRSEAEIIIEKYASVDSVVDCFDAIIDFVTHKKNAVFHIYHSVNRELFEHHLMDLGQQFIQQYVDKVLKDENLTEEEEATIIHYYKCACFGFVIDWLNHGMKDDTAVKGVRKMLSVREDMVHEIITALKGYNKN